MWRYWLPLVGLVAVAFLFSTEPEVQIETNAISTSEQSAPNPVAATAVKASLTELQPALAELAQVYEQQIRYPEYSIPLSEQQLDLLYPNRGAEVSRDLRPLGLNGDLVVSLDRYRAKVGSVLSWQGRLLGEDDLTSQISYLSARLEYSQSDINQVLTTAMQNTPSGLEIKGEFEVPNTELGEWRLVVTMALVDGADLRQSAVFHVIDPVAAITGIGRQQQQGNELVIPVQIEDAEPGYYKLSANIYSADERPLSHLQGKAKLGRRGVIELRLHGSLIHSLPQAQALLLGQLQLRRIPAKPGSSIRWGESEEAQYRLQEVNPQQFDSTPHQDATAVMRLQFLQQLGSTSITN